MTRRYVEVLTGVLLAADGQSRHGPIAVRLRSGKVVDGTFIAADSKTVRLLLANGTRVGVSARRRRGRRVRGRAAARPRRRPTPWPNPRRSRSRAERWSTSA